jgi:essential nuclear protein 1
MPRALKQSEKPRQAPLHVQIDEDKLLQKYGRVTQPGKRRKQRADRTEDDNSETILDPKTSRRIFELAKDQQDELELSDPEDDKPIQNHSSFSTPHERRNDLEDDEDEDGFEDEEDSMLDQDAEEVFEIDEQDLQTLDALLPKSSGERKTLADVIFAKLDEDAPSSNVALINNSQRGIELPSLS